MFNRIILLLSLFLINSITYAASAYIAPTITFESFSATDARANEMRPQFAFGYGDLFCSWLYLAGEIFVGTKAYTINSNPAPSGSLRTGTKYGIGILPGYPLDDTVMLYGRLGLVNTEFTSFNTTRNGYQIGIGAEAQMFEGWNIRGEYIYTQYKNLDGLNKPKVNEGDVGFIYRFM